MIVAAHRQNRPWIGELMEERAEPIPEYDPSCTFCPGNARASGIHNPGYEGVFVFDNDLPCVGEGAAAEPPAAPGFYRNRAAQGVARVVCYTPRHDLTLAQLDVSGVDALLATWQQQYRELVARPGIRHVLVFENKGEVVGVSNPHPHGQIYATNFVFKTIETEAEISRSHRAATGRVLFQDVIAAEKSDGRRVLHEHESAIAFVPYFARYAYEVYVAPRETHASLASLNDAERLDLASVLRRVLVQYDNLWKTSFPYVMALHQAPTDGADQSGFHFHIEFHPPLRKPNLLKYLAGPEIGGGSFLSDTSPEEKAAELRGQPERHYKDAGAAR